MPASAPPSSPKETMQLIKHDANLYRVDSKLYRSEQLNHDDLAAVHQLGIRAILGARKTKRFLPTTPMWR